jgi:hypothetical protein
MKIVESIFVEMISSDYVGSNSYIVILIEGSQSAVVIIISQLQLRLYL